MVEVQNTLEQEQNDISDNLADDLSVLVQDDQEFVQGLSDDINEINFISDILASDLKDIQGDAYSQTLSEYSDAEELIIQDIMGKIKINKYMEKSDKEGASAEYHKTLNKKIFQNDILMAILNSPETYPNFVKHISENVAEDESEYFDNSLRTSRENTVLSFVIDNIMSLEDLSETEQNDIIKALRPDSGEGSEGGEHETGEIHEAAGGEVHEAEGGETGSDDGPKGEPPPSIDKKDESEENISDNKEEDSKDEGTKEEEKKEEYIPDHTINEAKVLIIKALKGDDDKTVSDLKGITKIEFESEKGKEFGSKIASMLSLDKYNSILSEPVYQSEKAGNINVTTNIGMESFLSSVKDYLSYYPKMEKNTPNTQVLSEQMDILYTKLQTVFTNERNTLMFDVNTTDNESLTSGENALKALKYLKKIERTTGTASTLGESELAEFMSKIDTKSITTADQANTLASQLAIAKKLAKALSETKQNEVDIQIENIVSDINILSQPRSLEDQVQCYTAMDELLTNESIEEDDDENEGGANVVQLEKGLTPILEGDFSSDAEVNTMVAGIKKKFETLKAGAGTNEDIKNFMQYLNDLQESSPIIVERMKKIMKTQSEKQNDKKEKEKEEKQNPLMKSRKQQLIGNIVGANNLSLLAQIDPENALLTQQPETSGEENDMGGFNDMGNAMEDITGGTTTVAPPDLNTISKTLQVDAHLSPTDISTFLEYSQEDFQSQFPTFNEQYAYLMNILRYTYTLTRTRDAANHNNTNNETSMMKSIGDSKTILAQVQTLMQIPETNTYYFDYKNSDLKYYLNEVKNPKNATEIVENNEQALYYQDNKTPIDVTIETTKLTYLPYPNPVPKGGTMSINLGYNSLSEGGALFDTYSIYDMSGKLVKETKFVTNEGQENILSIDLSSEPGLQDMAAGVYLINLSNSEDPTINLNTLKKEGDTPIGVKKFVVQ